MVYSYGIYPWIMQRFSQKASPLKPDQPETFLPRVSIITAVYNEEAVLDEKLSCLDNLDYPRDLLHIYFGSDKSTDRSNELLFAYSNQYSHVTFIPFEKRQGKIGVINQLGRLACEEYGHSRDHILVYNDANVMVTPELLKKFVQNFRSDQVALVDANMVNVKLQRVGISMAERAYINREVMLKHAEGRSWGLLQGAFGGCYGLRSDFFIEVPNGYLVDDFYISFNAMMNGGKAINDLEAVCFENASHDIWQEFKRKSRISAGNFQNLRHILKNWHLVSRELKFCFISHKVIRWFGPFLMIVALISAIWLTQTTSLFYQALSWLIIIGVVVVPFLDLLLIYLNIHFTHLRKVRYFVMMNIALLLGFFRYIKGIKNGYWEPPKRV